MLARFVSFPRRTVNSFANFSFTWTNEKVKHKDITRKTFSCAFVQVSPFRYFDIYLQESVKDCREEIAKFHFSMALLAFTKFEWVINFWNWTFGTAKHSPISMFAIFTPNNDQLDHILRTILGVFVTKLNDQSTTRGYLIQNTLSIVLVQLGKSSSVFFIYFIYLWNFVNSKSVWHFPPYAKDENEGGTKS